MSADEPTTANLADWTLRNLDRLEDEIERDGLHALARLTRAEAAALRDQMEAEWKRATGGDPLPAEAVTLIDRYMAEEQGRADKVDMQARAATEMEQAGAKSAIEGIRKARKVSALASQKGAAGAVARWSGKARDALASIINDLATRTDALGDWLPPAELWPELHSAMDSRGLGPVETTDAYSYGDGEEITYEAFRRRIQRARQ